MRGEGRIICCITVLVLVCAAALAENSHAATGRVGVLLLNLGGPDEKEDSVRGFLYNLFADPDIIRLPRCLSALGLQQPLAYLISSMRAPRSAANYAMISHPPVDGEEPGSIGASVGSPGEEGDGGNYINSPINAITRLQATGLELTLRRRIREAAVAGNATKGDLTAELAAALVAEGVSAGDVSVYHAMRYWHPFATETLAQMKADGVRRLVVLPLYPQYSISTTRSSLKSVQDVMQGSDVAYWGNVLKIWHTVIPYWYQRPGYVRLLSELLLNDTVALIHDSARQQQIGAATDADHRVVHVVFSAHGVPVSYIQQFRDPYQGHVEQAVLLTARHLCGQLAKDSTVTGGVALECVHSSIESAQSLYTTTHTYTATPEEAATAPHRIHFHLSFQSKVGPVEWLQPYTDDMIEGLGKSGGRNLVVVPISFVSDHIETLHELDIEYREVAEKHGIKQWRRGAVANVHPQFIDELALMVLEALTMGSDSDRGAEGKLHGFPKTHAPTPDSHSRVPITINHAAMHIMTPPADGAALAKAKVSSGAVSVAAAEALAGGLSVPIRTVERLAAAMESNSGSAAPDSSDGSTAEGGSKLMGEASYQRNAVKQLLRSALGGFLSASSAVRRAGQLVAEHWDTGFTIASHAGATWALSALLSSALGVAHEQVASAVLGLALYIMLDVQR